MSLHIRQWDGLVISDDRTFEAPAGVTELAYLSTKSASATNQGWIVTPVLGGFDAVKVRWGGMLCTREFRIV